MFGVSQHVDVAALLIKYNACVNATDKWAFTPLHEAAQKGRTQLCALLLAHGADPALRNQEGQSPLDLVTVPHESLCSLCIITQGRGFFYSDFCTRFPSPVLLLCVCAA